MMIATGVRPMAHIATYALALALPWAGSAQASVRCDIPMTQWQPRDAVVQLAQQNGWDGRRIKIDDGCYEIYATYADGQTFEAKIRPDTLAIIEIESDDDDDHDDHDDARGDH